ncbi:MAG: MFS transporter [Pseudomonadota bacterium]
MWQALRSLWVLYFGLILLWFGTGVVHTLLVFRADAEGFSTVQIGLLQSAYQLGWLVAALIAPTLIRRVGHVRVFSAMAAASSAVIIAHLLVIEPTIWLAERFAMGICTAVLMVVCESWLNDMSANTVRGKVLALYTIISWGTPMIGVWLLRFASTESAFFFIVASICISLAVVPMLLSASRTPRFLDTQRLGFRTLYRRTPLGVIGALLSGACHGAFFATVALFGTVSGFSVAEISTLITIALGGGVITQWPIALLSDRYDRRAVLASVSALGAVTGLYFGVTETDTFLRACVAAFLLSACVLSLYSQCIAHTNDHIATQEVVPAASTLILLYGLGFAITPAVTAPLLDHSPAYFFHVNALLMAVLATLVCLRMLRREARQPQTDMVAIPTVSPYASVVTAAEHWVDETPRDPPEDSAR